MSFESLGLSNQLLFALRENQFSHPTPIQKLAIPEIVKGKDVLGIAKTGSGKTMAYALPLLQRLEGTESENRHITALVLVPTRELAAQVSDVFIPFSKALAKPLITMAVYGGTSINTQMRKMNNVDILIATPGRLLELIESNAVHLKDVKALVLDEADKMLNKGFKIELDQIIKLMSNKRQNLLFSATLSDDVSDLTQLLLNNPVTVSVEEKEEDISLIKQIGYRVQEGKKGALLRHLMKEKEMTQVLIFCSSTYQVDHVNDKLKKNGIASKAIHSKKSQGARNSALTEFKTGELTALVTTDLLARGIDIEFLPYVINYELPRSPKDFVHRIGRTGRAENTGEAITFISTEEAHHWRVIQKKMKIKVWTEDLPEWNPK
ncbi:MAG: DEAD/DEAH box helicase [Nonlabens sp.]|uniref:DEAD/DEAH box helicase n=1 Tax=Nonlabens sp. TaxID=1888209 RepID=UPI003EF5C06F